MHILHIHSVCGLKISLSLSLSSLSQTTLTQLRSVVSPFIQEVQKMLSQMIESMHGENFAR